ncbi:nitrogen fixation protein NifR [Staphylococcus aureus]|nr:nitrogen fixation protein NifR [Staphylococcus aureus]AWI97357.1 nitrogen fixation protein NifR [Staphylococcus aureus]AWY02622.1 nitrogen fixation protein NifR [Staphylococcus aureus]AWY02687.1 nitrogen fixation protein NifR [Staphylococcus aureus]AXB22379.1 nitrogen fixation protein NifR [Staphylococcus aureus]
MAVADCGAQHREFQKEILQTMQVGGAPKKDDSKFIVVTTSSIMTPLLLL